MAGPKRRASSRRSREVERGTLGTHVKRSPRAPRRSEKRNSMSLIGKTPSRTSEIHQVMPKTHSRESRGAYEHRSRQKGFVLNESKKGRWRLILGIVLLAALVLAIAGGVMWTVLKGQANAKMHLSDAALSEVLHSPEEADDPYYVLITGDFTDPMREVDGPHLIMLARIDLQQRVLTLLSLPHNIEMTMSDDEYHILSYAEILGGDAELVTQVENLCGIELTHLVKIDAEQFVSLVNAFGGVEINLAQEADDPDTGSIYIPAGLQTLDGQQALTLARCDNYTTPLATRAQVQGQIIEALVRTVLNRSAWGKMRAIDTLASNVKTTMSFDDFWQLAKTIGRSDNLLMYSSVVPGQISVDPDGIFYSVNRPSFNGMMEAIKEGRNPDEAATIAGLTPELVKVSVKNGAGITGGASQVASMLESLGYKVPETGNADNYVYDETLVVYKTDLMKPTAEEILRTLGNGRTVEAGLFYDFDTDIMVIIGKDWVPTS